MRPANPWDRVWWRHQHADRPLIFLAWIGYSLWQAAWALVPGRRERIRIVHEGFSLAESGPPPGLSLHHLTPVLGPDVVYILAGHARCAAESILPRAQLLRGLGWHVAWTALQVIVHYVWAWLRGIPFCTRRLRVAMYMRFFMAYHPRVYLTTSSAAFPQTPGAMAAYRLGIKTVLWTYGQQITTFDEETPVLRPSGHEWTQTDELWLWSEHMQSHWPQRDGCRVRLIGPMMCGDPQPAMQEAEPNTIGIVDTTPYREAWTPWTSDYVQAFYEDILRLMNDVPAVTWLIKPKRPYDRARVNCMPQCWPSGVRVQVLPWDANPYEICRAALLIGMPFASPVMAGLYFGREGLFHDPLHHCRYHHYQAYQQHLTHTYQQLAKQVTERVPRRHPPVPPDANPHVRFAQALREVLHERQ